ncbi:MAG: class I SAM-dependent methyltransferase [Allosphingosinicella sp.]
MRPKTFAAALSFVLLASAGATLAASVRGDIRAALADVSRPEADRARDTDRKPAELIAFSGIKKGHKVVELAPGGGYFTRLLSPAVGPKGRIYALAVRPSQSVTDFAAAHPNVTVIAAFPGRIEVPEQVDVVWTTLNYHDFKNSRFRDSDSAAAINAAAFRVLKPGGTYIIVDHQAAPGAGASQTSTLHRIEDRIVKEEVKAAGFKLASESQLLRHPADDHSLLVQDSAIRGKTDQFVLRFRKPRASTRAPLSGSRL